MSSRSPVFVLAAAVLLVGTAQAQEVQSRFSANVGSRTDNLDFNSAGDPLGMNPNIRSSVDFKDLSSYNLNATGEMVFARRIVLKGSLSFGHVIGGDTGDVTVSDYAGNNRSGQFSEVQASAADSNLDDWSAGIGYRLYVSDTRTSITPMLGYSKHKQSLRMGEPAQQTFGSGGMLTAGNPLLALDSRYDTEWKGMWLGLNVQSQTSPRLNLFGEGRYHFADYSGKGDLNLRTDLERPKTFTHEANGNGYTLTGGASYAVTPSLSLTGGLSYQKWKVDTGREVVNVVNGTDYATRVNEVNWSSTTIFAGVEYVTQ
ncbi:MAG: hypothetical protein LJE84_07895 [Gammaproteobacteria bacterium]|nr:hypothetical protein [Gammaproteobacteria bacterium]